MCTKQKETGTYATPEYAGPRNKNRTNHKATILLYYIHRESTQFQVTHRTGVQAPDLAKSNPFPDSHIYTSSAARVPDLSRRQDTTLLLQPTLAEGVGKG